MVNSLDHVFGALADPTRRAILARLARGEAAVTELAEPFAISLPAVTKHLGVLESAGLVVRRREGRRRLCRLERGALTGAADWLETHRRFWNERLDSLEDYLAGEQENQHEHPDNSRHHDPPHS